jgi:hypothetical protein
MIAGMRKRQAIHWQAMPMTPTDAKNRVALVTDEFPSAFRRSHQQRKRLALNLTASRLQGSNSYGNNVESG